MGSVAIQKAVLTGFDGAKEADSTNERRPGSSPPPPGGAKVRVPRSAGPAAEAKSSPAVAGDEPKIKTTVTVAEEPRARAKSPAGGPRSGTSSSGAPKAAAPKRA